MGRYQQLFLDLLGLTSHQARTAEAPPKKCDAPAADNMVGFDPVLTATVKELAGSLGLTKLQNRVRVNWNARLRTTAGTANANTWQIDLNPRLRELDDAEETARILRHELAHLVAQFRVGRKRIQAHGVEWRTACADLGIAGEKSCHTLPFEVRRQRRKHAYRCNHCQTIVLRVRKFSRNMACWPCCKTHAMGEYDARFRFEKIPLEKAERELSTQAH